VQKYNYKGASAAANAGLCQITLDTCHHHHLAAQVLGRVAQRKRIIRADVVPLYIYAAVSGFDAFRGFEKSSNLDISRLGGRVQLSELCKTFHFTIVGWSIDPLHPGPFTNHHEI